MDTSGCTSGSGRDTYTGKVKDAFGFETTTVTRPLIIDGMKDVARNGLELIGGL